MIHLTNKQIIAVFVCVHVIYCIYRTYFSNKVISFIENINRYDISFDNEMLLNFQIRPKWMYGGGKVKDFSEKKKKLFVAMALSLKQSHESLLDVLNEKFVNRFLVVVLCISYLVGISYAFDLISFVKKIINKAE